MGETYESVLARLRRAYDAKVDVRERHPVEAWKHDERRAFLARIEATGAARLLEIGAGTGHHGRFFADAGLDVVCTDASPAMVEACRAKGLASEQADFLALERGWSFDAVFAMNCLLHVPRVDLPAALRSVAAVLVSDGWFFWGQYGGVDREATFADDTYEPKRFFSYVSDEAMLTTASECFDVIDFHTVAVDGEPGTHFQALTLRSRRVDHREGHPAALTARAGIRSR